MEQLHLRAESCVVRGVSKTADQSAVAAQRWKEAAALLLDGRESSSGRR